MWVLHLIGQGLSWVCFLLWSAVLFVLCGHRWTVMTAVKTNVINGGHDGKHLIEQFLTNEAGGSLRIDVFGREVRVPEPNSSVLVRAPRRRIEKLSAGGEIDSPHPQATYRPLGNTFRTPASVMYSEEYTSEGVASI